VINQAASLFIGGDVTGGGGLSSARISISKAGSARIGGSVTGGNGQTSSGSIFVGHAASFTLGGDLTGGSAAFSGALDVSHAGSVKIGGSVTGGDGQFSGQVDASSAGSLFIAGNVTGGSQFGAGAIEGNGDIGSIVIAGSVTAGSAVLAGGISFNGSIGSLKIGGDVSGLGTKNEFITANGNIGSITIGGTVTRTLILAGGFNGNAVDLQIGAVKVGGDWIASSLLNGVKNLGADNAVGGAGVNADNVNFGDAHDSLTNAGNPAILAKIASITIGGQILGTTGGTDHFGFVAEQIGSFKVGVVAIPLTPGAHNENRTLGVTGDVTIHEI
jgi:hypothetical protein